MANKVAIVQEFGDEAVTGTVDAMDRPGLRTRRAGQRCEGKKPYGYTADETKIVDVILSLRKEGKSYVAIAKRLNTDGMKSRSGKQWNST